MNISYKKSVLKLMMLLILILTPMTSWSKQVFTSPVEKVNFLELYSTQSCSSCPPAQAWVSNLKSDTKLWKTFIPVVFHVDYWDYLGWRDPYSDPKYSQRQRRYVMELGTGAYTPMFIIDGREDRRRSMSKLHKLGAKVGQLKVEIKNNDYIVKFTPLKRQNTKLKFYYSILGRGIQTAVTSGENQGRSLSHDFLSLQMGSKKLKQINNSYIGRIKLDISKTKEAPQKAIVFWVSQEGSLKPIQVIGGPIGEGL